MLDISAASSLDSVVGFALATVGLAFSAAAFFKLTWIACHNLFHAVERHCAFRRPVGAQPPGKP